MVNVSPSTVSRALKDNPQISQSLRLKIQEVAASLNFTINTNAINFKNNETKTIALIIPEFGSFFTPDLIRGITESLSINNYRLTIFLSRNKLKDETICIQNCINNRVDGILISLSQETKTIDHLEITNEHKIPVVIIDKSIIQHQYSEVVFNNYQDSIRCAQFLNNEKGKNILGVFGAKNLLLTKERLKGFMKIFKQNNCKIIYAKSSKEAEKEALKLNLHQFNSFYLMSDEVMLGFLSAYNMNPSPKPQNFIAFSDGNLPDFINPKVTYLLHSGEKMGTIATELLLDTIHNKLQSPKKVFISSQICLNKTVQPNL